jgi:hypothetical protein
MTVLPVHPEVKYRRIMLKLSGEQLGGNQGFGIEGDALERIAGEVAKVHKLGVQVEAAIFFAGLLRQNGEWTERLRIIWECLQQLLMVLHFRRYLRISSICRPV